MRKNLQSKKRSHSTKKCKNDFHSSFLENLSLIKLLNLKWTSKRDNFIHTLQYYSRLVSLLRMVVTAKIFASIDRFLETKLYCIKNWHRRAFSEIVDNFQNASEKITRESNMTALTLLSTFELLKVGHGDLTM